MKIWKLRVPSGLGRVLHGFSWMMAERMVSLILSASIGVLIGRYLGPHDYGMLSFVLAVASIASPIASLGLNQIITKELVHHPEQEGRILGTVSVLGLCGAVTGTVVVACWAFLSKDMSNSLRLYLILVMAAGILGRFDFLQFWFQAKGALKVYSIARIAVALIFAVLKVICVVLKMDITIFVIISAAETAVAGIRTMSAYALMKDKSVHFKWDADKAKDLLRRSWPLVIAGITAAIYLKIDVLMMARMRGNTELGIYASAARLSEIWYFVPTLFMNAAFPMLLSVRKQSIPTYHRRNQQLLDGMAMSAALLALMITLVGDQLIRFLFGHKFDGAGEILKIHIWSGVFIFMRAVLSKWLIAEDLYVFAMVTQGAGAVVNILANMVLIPRYGGIGAAYATLISYASASYLALLFHRRTWTMFKQMTLALLSPVRYPLKLAARLARARAS